MDRLGAFLALVLLLVRLAVEVVADLWRGLCDRVWAVSRAIYYLPSLLYTSYIYHLRLRELYRTWRDAAKSKGEQ